MKKIDFSHIPDKRSEGDTNMDKIHIVLLRILKVFHTICEENNLTYFLDSGSLLGAIRHKGFIPWDDDLDVVMPREDYEKFKKIAIDLLPEEYFLQCKDTVPKFKNNMVRIVDRKSTAIAEGKEIEDYKWHMGLFFDIFPMDQTNNPKRYRFLKKFFYYKYKNEVKRFIIRTIRHIFVFLIRKKNVFKIFKKILSRSKTDNKEYLIYGFEVSYLPFYNKKDIYPLRKILFEDIEVYIPNNYDSVLKKCYGDYMKIPPLENRNHHFKFVDVNKVCEFEIKDKQARYSNIK
ncbi:LicD family protein [Marinilabiliaceae bacterium JC040]|nr:LicD family protein [Marinilabiliaceae bacterium JC040]